jgi:3D (Asp-Asp-Asp) domain-containing protein
MPMNAKTMLSLIVLVICSGCWASSMSATPLVAPASAAVTVAMPSPEPPPLPDHPLAKVICKAVAGEFGEFPEWRLSLLAQGLQSQPRQARLTAYSSRCPDGGGPWTRWGTRVRPGICAADPRYWGPGSVIWVCDPVAQLLIVEDTGSAVKGRDRFDICFGADAEACERFGVQRLQYVPLYVAEPRRNWGDKPDGWVPPAPPFVPPAFVRPLPG